MKDLEQGKGLRPFRVLANLGVDLGERGTRDEEGDDMGEDAEPGCEGEEVVEDETGGELAGCFFFGARGDS